SEPDPAWRTGGERDCRSACAIRVRHDVWQLLRQRDLHGREAGGREVGQAIPVCNWVGGSRRSSGLGRHLLNQRPGGIDGAFGPARNTILTVASVRRIGLARQLHARQIGDWFPNFAAPPKLTLTGQRLLYPDRSQSDARPSSDSLMILYENCSHFLRS